MVLDMTPKGRNEAGPRGNLIDWVRRHVNTTTSRMLTPAALSKAANFLLSPRRWLNGGGQRQHQRCCD